MPRLPK
jgi:putative ABC transport system substrate-binding protein